MDLLRYFFNILTLTLLTFSVGLSAAPNYQTPEEICSTLGEKKNAQDLQFINDVSLLNETNVSCIIAPKNAKEISKIVRWINQWNKTHEKIHISVAGASTVKAGT